MKDVRSLLTALLLVGALAFLSGCDKDDPEPENIPEAITKVELTFSSVGAADVVVTATDPDGDGPQNYTLSGPINLARNRSYTLTVDLFNELAPVNSTEYFIGLEVLEEADEHMFFYGWTGNIFSDPAGNGNIDNRTDVVNYLDEDNKGLPLGLFTDWTTVNGSAPGTLRIVLKHQPGIKSAASTAGDGESDLDVTFNVSVN